MPNNSVTRVARLNDRLNRYVDRGVGGVALIALHEAGALRSYWGDLRLRAAVARRARGPGELLRDQVDLWPESRRRLAQEAQVRRQLWRGLLRDLSINTAPTAA